MWLNSDTINEAFIQETLSTCIKSQTFLILTEFIQKHLNACKYYINLYLYLFLHIQQMNTCISCPSVISENGQEEIFYINVSFLHIQNSVNINKFMCLKFMGNYCKISIFAVFLC